MPTAIRSRLSDLNVPDWNWDPNTGLYACELQPGLPSLTQAFVDTQTLNLGCRIKTLGLVVAAPVTSSGAQQATVQLTASRTSIGANSGAASTLGGAASTVGGTANWAGSVASIPAGIYWFSPTVLPELQWLYPFMGVEIHFPLAPTGGSYSVVWECSPQ